MHVSEVIKTSTSKSTTLNTSTRGSYEPNKRQQVQKTAAYLESILKPVDNSLPLFMKFAWQFSEGALTKLAIEAKETDKQGSPTRLFVYLVKKELGYATTN